VVRQAKSCTQRARLWQSGGILTGTGPQGSGEAVMEREQHRHGGTEGARLQEHAAWLEVTAALDLLPVPSLVLTSDGTALGANEAWAALSAAPSEVARGEGWLGIVDPLDRGPLRGRLSEAAAVGQAGSADFQLAGPAGGRLSRWWWRPGPAGRLLVCVADLDEHQPRHPDPWHQEHGPLARLVRRSEFLTLAERALRRARCDGTHVAVVAVSLDGTASARHGTGQRDDDAVMRIVAERILGAVGPAGVAAQVGRSEFAILYGDVRSPDDAGIAASRVHKAVAQTPEVEGVRFSLAALTGFALPSSPSETAEALIARACLTVRSARMDQSTGSLAPVQGGSPGSVAPADGQDNNGQTPAFFPSGPDTGTDAETDLAGIMVHRLFGVGLTLQSAAGLADGLVAHQLGQAVARKLWRAVDELDAIIRDVRTAALKLQYPRHRQD
jgi:GGDEF domain-containing protein